MHNPQHLKAPQHHCFVSHSFSLHDFYELRSAKSTGELERKKEKYASSKTAPHINQGKGAIWEEKPLHQKKKKAVSED